MVEVCVPLTDIFRRNQEALLPIVAAVSFKEPTGDTFEGKEQMLESSLNIADPLFPRRIDGCGLLSALQSGRFTSFACDLGPPWTGFTEGRSPNGYPRYVPGAGPMAEGDYIEKAERNVAFLRNKFSGKIKVENLNYFPTGAYELICDPGFIARGLRHLRIELLLDIGHLIISAHNLGISLEDYLSILPLELVSEVHLSGPSLVEGIWEDAHDLPSRMEFATLDMILERSTVRFVTVEYYKDDRELVALCRGLHKALATKSGIGADAYK